MVYFPPDCSEKRALITPLNNNLFFVFQHLNNNNKKRLIIGVSSRRCELLGSKTRSWKLIIAC